MRGHGLRTSVRGAQHHASLRCVPEIVALGANRRRLTADAMAKTPTPSKATPRAAANDAFKEVQDVNENQIMRN